MWLVLISAVTPYCPVPQASYVLQKKILCEVFMFTPKQQCIGTRVVLETVDIHNTLKPVLRDHCHERPPVFTDIFGTRI